MKNVLTFDYETTTWSKGSPYDHRNWLVTSGWLLNDEYVETTNPKVVQELFDAAEWFVSFNAKFELAWTRRHYKIHKPVMNLWDVQIAHFIITCQQHKYPSLNDVLSYYNLPLKVDKVKEYWEQGLNTQEIPKEVLSEYQEWDVRGTYECFKRQWEHPKNRLIRQDCWDTLVLSEMEYNGMLYDLEGSRKHAEEIDKQVLQIEAELNDLTQVEGINWGSNQHLSAVLFGGQVKYEVKEDYLFTYKDPKKPPVMKTRKVEKVIEMPRLCTPKRATAKPGVWKVDEDTLSTLRATGKAKKIIELVSKKSKLDKINGTYLKGIVNRYEESGWTDSLIHGNLNQVSVVTGRLSSDKPNLQNVTPDVKMHFKSRYD